MKTRHNLTFVSQLRSALFLAIAMGMTQLVNAATTFTWNVGTPGLNNWAVNANWNPSTGNPGSADTAVFNAVGTNSGTAGINNIVSVNTTITALLYTNLAQWHVTQIPSGVTLTVSGGVTFGGFTSDGTSQADAVTGGGTLSITGGNFQDGNSGASAFQNITTDLSGLSNLVYNVSSGAFNFGSANRSGGTLTLAATNLITASSMSIGTGSSSSTGSANLKMGYGTNVFFANTITISAQRESSTVNFNAVSGGLLIRGTSGGASRATMTVGNAQNNSSPTGSLLFNGHFIDVKAGTFTLGEINSGSAAQTGTGNLSFDQGTFDATTINMAIVGSGTALTQGAVSRISVGTSGTLIANSISLVNLIGTGSGDTASGTLMVTNGGVLICSNGITKTTAAGTGTIIVTNGSTLNMVGGTVGTTALPIDSVTVNGTTVQLSVANASTNIVATTFNDGGTASTVNVASVPAILAYPTQFPVIKYGGGAIGGGFNLALGTLPGTFSGYISNDAVATVWLVITNGPALPKEVVWQGVVGSGDWDTTTANWTNTAGTAVTYNESDFVVLDDSAGTNVVNLTATRTPGGLTNSSTANYTLVGSGISGSAALVKQGSGTLLLDNGNNAFSSITISGGTVQSGNNDANGVLASSGNISDNGALVLASTAGTTISGVISGSGTVTQSGSGTNVLNGINSYSGATLISGGMVQINNAGAGTGNSSLGAIPGGAVTITNGGTLDLGGNSTANQLGFTNAAGGAKQFYVSGTGIGGNGAIINSTSVNQQNAFQFVTLTADTTFGGPARFDIRGNAAIVPQLDLGGFTLTKTGAGQVSLVSATITGGNITIDQGILSIEATPSFTGSGTITVNNGGFLGQFKDTLGAFTRNIVLHGGGTTNLSGNNSITYLDAPILLTADSTLGTSGGTEIFNGVISDGGNHFGLTKVGSGTNVLGGVNTYSGDTIIIAGRLGLTNAGSIANSPHIIVAGSTVFDVFGPLLSPFALGAAQTLSNSSSTALLSGNIDASVGTVSLTFASGTPSFVETNGTLTLASGTTFKVNNTSSALASGSYKVISKATTANVGSVSAATVPSVTVGGGGIASAQHASLSISGGELFLNVTNHAPAIANNPLTNSVISGLNWKIAISSLSNSAAGWSDADGDTISLTSVDATSALGTTVTNVGGFIFYTGPVTAEDHFNYVISDGTLTTTGTVYLEATNNPGQTYNITGLVTNGGSFVLSGASIPGRTNTVQVTTSLAPPITWSTLTNVLVGSNGLWQATDPSPPSPAFYRSVTQ